MTKKEVNKQSVKPITAWAVEVDGDIDIAYIEYTRRKARRTRELIASHGINAHVRKIQISVIPGR